MRRIFWIVILLASPLPAQPMAPSPSGPADPETQRLNAAIRQRNDAILSRNAEIRALEDQYRIDRAAYEAQKRRNDADVAAANAAAEAYRTRLAAWQMQVDRQAARSVKATASPAHAAARPEKVNCTMSLMTGSRIRRERICTTVYEDDTARRDPKRLATD